MDFFVYILRCQDGTLYTGIAKDVARRFFEHKIGTGAKYTRTHKPVKIVYEEKVGTRGKALSREAEIKKMSRSQKLAFIAGSTHQPSRVNIKK